MSDSNQGFGFRSQGINLRKSQSIRRGSLSAPSFRKTGSATAQRNRTVGSSTSRKNSTVFVYCQCGALHFSVRWGSAVGRAVNKQTAIARDEKSWTGKKQYMGSPYELQAIRGKLVLPTDCYALTNFEWSEPVAVATAKPKRGFKDFAKSVQAAEVLPAPVQFKSFAESFGE